jgi:5-(carboxyamino)imidazole ribonucleotide mutase
MSKKSEIAILVGSESDLPLVHGGVEVLEELGIGYKLMVTSAHRTPEQTLIFATQADKKGFKVLIVGAGMAAHLAGVVAAHTLLPVIGVPIDSKLDGLDALLSTVQMPRGIPVGTVTIGKTGFVNAALLAAQILGISNIKLRKKLLKHREAMKKKVLKADKNLQGRKNKRGSA